MPLFGGPSIKKLQANRDIHGLVALRMDNKVERKIEALQALEELAAGDSSVVPTLIGLLGSADSGERAAAAWGLQAVGDGRAVEPLISALEDESAGGVRDEVIAALGDIGDSRALAPLVTRLRSEDLSNRVNKRQLVKAVGKIGGPEAVAALISALAAENKKVVRDGMIVDEIVFQLDMIRERTAAGPDKTTSPRTIQGLLVLSLSEIAGVQDLLQQIVDQQRGRGHSLSDDFRAESQVTNTPRDAAYAYAAVRTAFPDLYSDDLGDRTERFDFQGGGTSGHYYIVFDRPRP